MSVILDPKTKKYYAQVKYRDQDGKQRAKRKRGFSTKREAHAWERETRDKVCRNVFDFQALATTYFDTLEVTRSTRDLRDRRLNKYMATLLPLDVRDITKPIMQTWRVWLSEQELSSTTKNNILTLCKSIFHFGFQAYGLQDPAAILRPFKKRPDEVKTMQVWTVDEFNQFISAVDHPVYHALFRLLFWSGMRRGEALALTCDDLLPGNRIKINKSFRRRIDGIGPTKNAASVRTIVLDELTFQELEAVCARSGGPYIFGGKQPLATQSVSEHFNSYIERSGVKKIRLHDLRHSHASMLLNDPTISVVAVSSRLGHRNVATTMSTYTHVIDKATKELNSKIASLASSESSKNL